MNSTSLIYMSYYFIFRKLGVHLLETWMLLNSMGLLAFDLGLVQGQVIDSSGWPVSSVG